MFDVVPSKLRPILYVNSLRDIETKTRLRVGLQQSLVVQEHQTLAMVLSQMLGGSEGETSSAPKADVVYEPKTVQEMTMAFNAVLGNGR